MPLNYLALGDSYTIGEAVLQESSFPFQLVRKLRETGLELNDPEIIATTGWTTDELIQAIKEKDIKVNYDLVTLLIGVNNQYRGYSKQNYRAEFKELLQSAISYAAGQPDRVYVISIPDWGVTSFAQKSDRDAAKISSEIDAFNVLNKEEALKAGVAYLDITPGSRKASGDPSLLAEDGLHPSGIMYAEWANALTSVINRKSE